MAIDIKIFNNGIVKWKKKLEYLNKYLNLAILNYSSLLGIRPKIALRNLF